VDRYYFDHNATTPVSPEVMDAMLPMLTESFGNASSIHHFGQVAKQRLEGARRQVAALLGCTPAEICWTSGGTESNNLAIQGVLRASGPRRQHAVTTAIEHPAVLSPMERSESFTVARVGSSGIVDPGEIRKAIRPGQTAIVSVMHANNEIGTIQPLAEIAAIVHEAGALLHVDGVQAAGKIPALDVRDLDLYTISGHKLGAPKGIGALYVRKGVKLDPLLFGGHQERDRRPGTENAAGAVALGRAAQWWIENGSAEAARLSALRDRLERGILARVGFAALNCSGSLRVSNTANVRFDGIEGEPLVIALDLKGFAVSSGAACSSGAVEPSHVLTAIGLSKEDARSCLRISLGRSNDVAQVDALIGAVSQAAHHLYKLSPAYAG
jgi:cysteine desulfurase